MNALSGSKIQRIKVPSITVAPEPNTNSYLIGEGGRWTLVEMGGDTDEAVAAVLDRLDDVGGRIEQIVLTHHHLDHICGARRMHEVTGAPVWIHAMDRDDVSDIADVRTYVDGTKIETSVGLLEVLHTPGHAQGHGCLYYAPERALFSGDMINGVGYVVILPPEGDMRQYLESLGRLRSLDLATLYPGHGPIVTDPYAKIDEYVDHRLAREAKVVRALGRGPNTLDGLLPIVYDDVSPSLFFLAEGSLYAHLNKLCEDGRARWMIQDDGEKHFELI
ncbi:MAG: MBL fold metallo-hydrolase [Myxococcales bacterium]|nr:MBL fold metallo-hydrolase [Myxococcales bacterium]